MLDQKQFRKKVLLRLLGSPLVVVPFMLGMTGLTAAWAFGMKIGLGLFAGLAGVLISCGAFLTRLILRGDRVSQEVAAELERAQDEARQKALDELDRQLTVSDQDPRPEAALRDLRALVKAFEETKNGSSDLNISVSFDIYSMVDQLFEQCVQSLEQTMKLWQMAHKLHSPPARKPILEQREKIVADIQASIKQLSDTLVALQSLGSGNRSTSELARIRDELDQSLAIAKIVEARLHSLVKETDIKAHEQPLQINPQEKG